MIVLCGLVEQFARIHFLTSLPQYYTMLSNMRAQLKGERQQAGGTMIYESAPPSRQDSRSWYKSTRPRQGKT